jgi:hypothetical protein
MSKWLMILFLLLPRTTLAGPWTLVQVVNQNNLSSAKCGATAVPAGSCNISITATGAGHLLILAGYGFNSNSFSFSCSSSCGTWVVPAASPIGTNPYVGYAYILSSTAGATTATVQFTSGDERGATFYEFSYSGTAYLKSVNSGSDASNTSLPGVSLTPVAGGNDILWQFISAGTTPSINGSYTAELIQNGGAVAYLANSSTGTAPTWTVGSATAVGVSGLDFSVAVIRHRVKQE